MLLILIWVLCGVVAAMIGAKQGEGCAAFIVGLLLGPFGILMAIFSKGNRITCPYCKELVHKEALVCKHCGKDLKSNPRPQAGKPMYRDPVDEWERTQRLQRGNTHNHPTTITCPLCETPIDASRIQIGKNTCPSCNNEFEAE